MALLEVHHLGGVLVHVLDAAMRDGRRLHGSHQWRQRSNGRVA
jgi:hypothetical protein